MPGSVVGAARLVREHCVLFAWWKSYLAPLEQQIPRFARDDKFVLG